MTASQERIALISAERKLDWTLGFNEARKENITCHLGSEEVIALVNELNRLKKKALDDFNTLEDVCTNATLDSVACPKN